MNLKELLHNVQAGSLSIDQAEKKIKELQESDLGFAHLDIGREARCGVKEVIYCPNKTNEQIVKIISRFLENGQDVFASRATEQQYQAVAQKYPQAVYHKQARAIRIDLNKDPKPSVGNVVIVSGGTGDIPVAEEAGLACEWMGANTKRLYDIGIAGLHRVISRLHILKKARVIIAVAGMEGALPSVIAGLVDKPIIAVPTSVGYGAGFEGFAALLAMLNSCVPGISVVNIDNGLSAGIAAALINRTGEEI
jgi:pyridinium-3,5-biscarboxylic acid mononucleotide synthase